MVIVCLLQPEGGGIAGALKAGAVEHWRVGSAFSLHAYVLFLFFVTDVTHRRRQGCRATPRRGGTLPVPSTPPARENSRLPTRPPPHPSAAKNAAMHVTVPS